MAQFVNIFDVDLQKPNSPQRMRQTAGEGDAKGLKIGARVTDNGSAVSLGGSCVGKVVRADGATVQLTGTIDGNLAYVVLDQASCAIEGPIQVAVCWVSGSNVTTLVVAYGTIVHTQTGNAIQPSTPIPDLTQLLAAIDDMEAATAAATAAADGALGNFAPAFVEATANAAGTYVTYTDGKMYYLPDGHAANATWANTTKAAVTVGGEFNNLKNAINNIDGVTVASWSAGYIKTNGETVDISTIVPSPSGYPHVCTVLDCAEGDVFTITGTGGNASRLWCFIDASGNSLSVANANAFLTLGKITAPANSAKVVINSLTSRNPFAIKGETIQSKLLLCMRSGSTTLIITDAQAESVLNSDANSATVNTIIGIGQTGLNISNLPLGTSYTPGNLITYGFRTGSQNGINQLFIAYNGRVFVRSYTLNAWTDWNEIAKTSDTNTLTTTTMVISEATAETMFSKDFNNLLPNKIYCIGSVNLPISNMPYSGFAGTVMCMDFRETSSTSGRMQIAISSINKLYTRIHFGGSWKPWQEYEHEHETVYYVGSTRTHTSLIGLLKTIQTDTSQKVIYMDEGEYDIFQEYKDNNIPSPPAGVQAADYFDYNVFLPQNTRLVGIGNVVLKWNPTTSDITTDESKTWSPLNLWYGNNTVENITILCKNGRYGIHDDSHNAYTGFTNKYKNVRVIYTQSDTGYGFNNTIGFGFEDKCIYEFDDCMFQFVGTGNHGVFYGHDGYYGGASIIVRNCVLLGGSDSNARTIRLQSLRVDDSNCILTLFAGCHVQGGIHLTQYNSSAGQFFDVTLLHSGNPTQTIDIGNDNPYPIKVYQ